MDLLSVHDLQTYFFTSRGVVKAVDGVNITIGQNEAVALVGESGCGKTMTAFSIIGLVPWPGKIVRGEILFKGENLLDKTEEEMRKVRGKEISMIFQDPMTYLNPVIKVGDQVKECILLHQTQDVREAETKVIDTFRDVGLPSPSVIANYFPHQLSGGMRQRVVISMAISCKPSLLIADEPTTALDVTVQAQILDLIMELKEKLAVSLLLITHDLGIVAETCELVFVMYAGKIVETGEITSIYGDPKHPYTIGLIKGVLSINEFREKLVTIRGSVPDMLKPPLGCRFHPRCPQAKAICRKETPPMIEIKPKHSVSCWNYA